MNNEFYEGFEKTAGIAKTLGNITGVRPFAKGVKVMGKQMEKGDLTYLGGRKIFGDARAVDMWIKGKSGDKLLNKGAKRMALTGAGLTGAGVATAYGINKLKQGQEKKAGEISEGIGTIVNPFGLAASAVGGLIGYSKPKLKKEELREQNKKMLSNIFIPGLAGYRLGRRVKSGE